MKSILSVFFILISAVAGFVGFEAYSFLRSRSTSVAEVVFEVRPGQSAKTVAQNLYDLGLVESATKFYWYARLQKTAGRIRVGEYAIAPAQTPREILNIITSGHSLEHAVTIQEGFNIFEIAEVVEKKGLGGHDEFLNIVRDHNFIRQVLNEDRTSLEGYLFPETYHVTKFTGLKGLVKMMVARFHEVYKDVPPTAMSRHQLVTLASIIEKETGAPEERPIISSVFHNRLNQGMRLQTDPTIIYGIFVATGSWNKKISRADLSKDNPYNTYTRDGLPPGPIANPSREALLAASQPQQSPYLYFVSRNDGTHTFTKTYQDHERAVMQFQLNARAREGKSWRDLQRRNDSAAMNASGRATGPANTPNQKIRENKSKVPSDAVGSAKSTKQNKYSKNKTAPSDAGQSKSPKSVPGK